MLFNIVMGVYLVCATFMLLGWYFNTNYFHAIEKILWVPMGAAGLLGLVVLPMLIAAHFNDDPTGVEVFQKCFLIGMCFVGIICLFQGAGWYRSKYILPPEDQNET